MILVVGLSPVWQRTLAFANVVPGKVNRATGVSETASGKGVNVAHVIRQLGASTRLLTVAGGYRGKLLQESLRAKKIPARVVSVAAETRICQTLLSAAPTTELVEEAGAMSKREVKMVLAAFDMEVRRAKAVALSGTVPRGCGDEFYARLTRAAGRRGLPVLVDAQRQQLLHAVAQRPLVVKVNREELLLATGQQRCGAAIRELQAKGAQWVVISDGEGLVLVAAPTGELVELRPPRIKAVNPIGSGDAMLAGIAVGITRAWEMLHAVKYGMACGAANALTAAPGNVRLVDLRRLWRG